MIGQPPVQRFFYALSPRFRVASGRTIKVLREYVLSDIQRNSTKQVIMLCGDARRDSEILQQFLANHLTRAKRHAL